jgi:hypothetical protein
LKKAAQKLLLFWTWANETGIAQLSNVFLRQTGHEKGPHLAMRPFFSKRIRFSRG